MIEKKYKLRYLPLFYEELNDAIEYILNELKSSKAANDLLEKVEKEIM